MDHLPEPVDPTYPSIRVAYVAEPYDGGGFLDYQARHPMLESHTLHERHSYLQTWLYFGLLHETLGEIFRLENYVDSDELGPIVCTTILYADLDLWIKQMAELGKEQKDAMARHTTECFDLWHQILLQNNWSRDFSNGLLPLFDRGFRQSLAALGEAVYWTSKLIYGEADILLHSAWDSLYIDKTILPMMQRQGWCPNEASRVLQSIESVSIKHFAARISKTGPERREQHRDCTTQVCRYAQIDPATFRPKHVGDCSCEEVGPDLDAVISCLARGTFPVLQISVDDSSEVRLEVVPWDEGSQYVAISHVWADGLGNPSAMKLPRCQLLRLEGHVRRLECYKADTPRRLSLWCDTLCCPVESHLKSQALRRMRGVYENATYVLALDSSLLPYEYGRIGPIETSIPLLSSSWTGRLWTMQECALAKTLLVQLADQFVDVDNLVWEATRGYGAWLRFRAMGKSLMIELDQLRDVMRNDSGSVQMRFQNVFHAVKFRRVSYQSDEPACLATLMNLDLSAIVRADDGDRMREFWKLLSSTPQGIPKDIVFNTGLARMEQLGFRWAPSSFMYDLDSPARLTEMTTNGSPERMASLTAGGIAVSYPAWELKLPPIPPHDLPDLRFPDNLTSGRLRLRHSDGEWYQITPLAPDWRANNPTLWNCCVFCQNPILIFTDLPTSTFDVHRGVLGSVYVNPEGEEILRTVTVVGLKKAGAHEQIMWSAGVVGGQLLRDEALRAIEGSPGGPKSDFQERTWALGREILRDRATFESMCTASRLSADRSLYNSVLTQLVISILFGYEEHYLTDGQHYPASKKWTID